MAKLNKKINELKQLSQQGLTNEIATTAALSDRTIKKTLGTAGFKQSKGGLIQGTSYGYAGKQAFVQTAANYAPFIEFGTRYKKIELDDLKELGLPVSYASQFKASPLKKATNISAKPFFFPSIRIEFRALLNRLEKRIKDLT